MAETIGEAEVLITADFSTFENDLRAKLVNAARKAGNDAEKELKRSGDRSGKAFSDGVSKSAGSAKTLDSIRASIERLEAASVRAGNSQIDAANRVSRAEAALAKVKRETSLVTIDGAEKIIAAEDRVAKAKRDAARADATVLNSTKALSSARAKLADEGSRAGDAFGVELTRAVRKESSKAGNDGGNFFSRAFQRAAKSVGSGLLGGLLTTLRVGGLALLTSLSPLPTLLGGATAATVALSGALVTASGSAISLAGVLGALGLGAVALKVGFSGVGDALKEQTKAQAELAATGKISKATQDKLDASLKNLAPSARAVVKEIAAMAPAWRAVQKSVQGKLFAGVGAELANLGNRFLPILNTQLGAAATTLNRTAVGLGNFLNTSVRSNQISSIFTGLNGILRTLLQPVQTITAGFLNIFQTSLPFAQRLAVTLSNIGTNFGQWLSRISASGAFTQFMQLATTLAGQLFRLLGNVGSILGQVFSAGNAAGGNLLSLLTNITGQFAAFLQTAAGQAGLASFFGLISQAGQVLVGVFQKLSPLLSGIGVLFDALKPAIASLGVVLTPVITALSTTIGAGLAQLGPVIAALVTSLAPVVALLGTALNGALQTLLPSIAQLVAGLTPLVTTILTVAVTLFQSLLTALLPLVPVIVQVATALASGLSTTLLMLVPVIQQAGTNLLLLVQAILPLVPSLLTLIPPAFQLAQALLQIVIALQPLTTSLMQSFVTLLIQLTPAILAVVPLMVSFTSAVARVVVVIAQVIAAVVRFAVQVQNKFEQARSFAVNAVSGLVSGVIGFFSSLPGRVAALLAAFIAANRTAVDRVVSFFKTLPGRVVSAVSGLASSLFAAGSQAVAGLVNGITSKGQAVIGAAQSLANKVKSTIGSVLKIFSPSRVTYAQGQFAGQGLVNGLLNKVRAVGRAATDLANAVPSAVGKALTKLDSSLISLSNGLSASAKRRIDAVVASGKSSFDALSRSSVALDAKLKAGQTKLQDLLQKSQQLAQSVAQSVLSTGDITQGQDTSFKGIVTRLQTAVTNAKQFSKVIASLTKAGLNATSLQQIVNAGPDTGTAIGEALLQAGKSGINQINKLQTQLQAAATQAATTASNAIFGQGIRLAQGLVAGLTKQKASLDAQMTRLADVLVRRVLALLQALKLPGVNTLKIPGLKDGGVVSGKGAAGTLIRAGEYGRKEAVIPLTRPKRARDLMDATGLSSLVAGGNGGNGSKGRTVEVPIHVGGSLVDYEALTKHIERVLQRYGFTPSLGIVTAGGAL